MKPKPLLAGLTPLEECPREWVPMSNQNDCRFVCSFPVNTRPSTTGRLISKTAPENGPRPRFRLTPAAGPKPIFPSHDVTPPLHRSRLPPHPPSNERRGSRALTHVGGRQRRTATALFRHKDRRKRCTFSAHQLATHMMGGKGTM